MLSNNPTIRPLPVENRWCVHAYYTLCPYAPDGSGRLLLAGSDLSRGVGETIILSADGAVLDRFGENETNSSFFHTGWWQTWSPDARFVYYQSGSLKEPRIVRRELATDKEIVLAGDMEGAPPNGEPLISCLMGMLYAAGYGTGQYQPEMAPAPFQQRDQHGIFEYTFQPAQQTLRLSVAEIIEQHPHRDKLRQLDRQIQQMLGDDDGLTLMTYCVRWSPSSERFLFYFGNHTVKGMAPQRGEPKLAYVFTSNRDMTDIHLALDISGKPGVHWGWHPDGEHLMGYGPHPDDESRLCLTQVRFDGEDYRFLSQHASGGHPSISPVDYNLLVTDDTRTNPGDVLFIDVRTDEVVQRYRLPRVFGETEPRGRNRYRVCHHPVFHPSGKKVLVNTLLGENAVLAEIDVPGGYF